MLSFIRSRPVDLFGDRHVAGDGGCRRFPECRLAANLVHANLIFIDISQILMLGQTQVACLQEFNEILCHDAGAGPDRVKIREAVLRGACGGLRRGSAVAGWISGLIRDRTRSKPGRLSEFFTVLRIFTESMEICVTL